MGRFHEKFDFDGAKLDWAKLALGRAFFLDGSKANGKKVEYPELVVFTCESINGPEPRPLREVVDEYIRQVVLYYDGNEHSAADALGISHRTLYTRTRFKDGVRFRRGRNGKAKGVATK